MTPAVASLLALLAVIVASLFSRVNVGMLAVALAWPIAMAGAGWKADALMQTFPASLFLTLLGVTLLFGASQTNGTMEALTRHALRLCRGNTVLLPPLFFAMACVVSTLGAGAIGTVLGAQELQRDRAMQSDVLGLENDAHAAGTERLENAVVRDDLANHRGKPKLRTRRRQRQQCQNM